MPNATLHHLLPRSTIRVVTHFLLNPDRRMHFRALKEHTQLGTGALQRELKRLEDMRLVWRSEDGGRVYHRPNIEHPSWGAFRVLLREHADPAEVLWQVLNHITGIHAAFIFGSTASGDTRPDSDVDVFILGDDPLVGIGGAALDAASLLEREIDVVRYTPDKLASRLDSKNAFVKNVISGPKSWIIGSESVLKAA